MRRAAIVVGLAAAVGLAGLAVGHAGSDSPPYEGDPRAEQIATLPAGHLAIEDTETAALRRAGFVPLDPDAGAPEDVVLRVRRGDTLMKLLTGQGIAREEADAAIRALKPVYDPRRLQIGQEVTVSLERLDGGAAARGLVALALQPSVEQDVVVERAASAGEGEVQFAARAIERELTKELARSGGTIRSSLYEAAVEGGMPMPVLIELIRIFSFDVDFQREIQPGDGFEAVYELLVDDTGAAAREGAVFYAAMTLSGERREFYRYTPRSGIEDYFDPRGQSVRKALMRTPIDGARLTSGFGMRRHPILGYSLMHRGIDFGAPSGTPIMAAGDGVVELAAWNGAYGRYIRLRHGGEYATAYAHMQRFARGIAAGKRVKQGQVIGYVGTTGRSTGPHLHYEVLRGGRQMNPMSVKLPAGEKLAGRDLDGLRKAISALAPRVAELREAARIAETGGAKPCRVSTATGC